MLLFLEKNTLNKERDESTHVKWEYNSSSRKLKIIYEGGIYRMGGEKTDVFYEGNKVFKVRDDCERKKDISPEQFILVEDNYVMKYIPGK
jgi:hypothetical protein